VVSWSLPATGTGIPGSLDIGTTVTGLSDFLSFDFTAQLTAAFNAWSAVANISFIQVADGGGTVGSEDHADIRIGGLPIDGVDGTLAFGYFPDQGAISGEIAFDTAEGSFWTPHSFFLVALHEISHALGLDHENGPVAVMNPYYNSSLNGLLSDDISGIQSIYGSSRTPTSYAMPSGQGTLTILQGLAGLTVTGNTLANTITGTSFAETFDGGGGNDTLTGGAGSDTLTGGTGDDTYNVGAGDIVIEYAGEGTDTVNAAISFTLADNVENLTLTGSGNINGTGNGDANVITGNAGNNTINSGFGDDTLNGGDGDDLLFGGNGDDILSGDAGADALFGGNGNDTFDGGTGVDFLVGSFGNDTYNVGAGDIVIEYTDEGTDTLNAAISFTLADNVENLTLTGSGNINGTGNGDANVITGNAGNNILGGGSGNDTFVFIAGVNGNDTISDFTAGATTDDVLDYSAQGITLGNLTITQSGGDTTITNGITGDVLTLTGVTATDLHTDDFLF
jgi:Ca2+-binding RTX toxin-like protein